jgi:acyl-CoA thioesterase-1
MTRGRWIALAVALVLVAVGVVVVVAGRDAAARKTPAAPAGQTADCRRITAQLRSPEASEVPGPGTRVAIVGDSYTSGYGLADAQDGYAYVLSRALGWRAAVDGFPGSGFTNGGACPDERYAERIGRIPADAALVLVEGGLNDVKDPSEVPAAADQLLAAVHARVPSAVVVVVGPPPVPGLDRSAVGTVSAVLAASSAAHRATLVDTSAWPLPYLPDGIHLTAAGHRDFARFLGAELYAQHLVPAPPALMP